MMLDIKKWVGVYNLYLINKVDLMNVIKNKDRKYFLFKINVNFCIFIEIFIGKIWFIGNIIIFI